MRKMQLLLMLAAVALLTSCGKGSNAGVVFDNYVKNADVKNPDGLVASLELTLPIPQGEGEQQTLLVSAIKDIISQSSIAEELGSPEGESVKAFADNYYERFNKGVSEGNLEPQCVYHLQITSPYSNSQCAVLHISDGVYANGGPREYVWNVRLSDGKLMSFQEIFTMTSSNVKELAKQYANEEDKEDISLNLEDFWLYPTSEGFKVKAQTGTHFFKDFVIPMENVEPYLTDEGKALFGIAKEETDETKASPAGGDPEKAVVELLECLKNKDYDAAIELTSDEKSRQEAMARGRLTLEQLKALIKKNIAKEWDDGIKSYEITRREMDEKEAIGLYYVDITMDNGKVRRQAMTVEKKNGKWFPGFVSSNYEKEFTLEEIVDLCKKLR